MILHLRSIKKLILLFTPLSLEERLSFIFGVDQTVGGRQLVLQILNLQMYYKCMCIEMCTYPTGILSQIQGVCN